MLATIPVEILNHIVQLLTRQEKYQLLTTCKYIYYASLSSLYSCLELGHYAHTRQLYYGISVNPYLKETILRYTRQLTLRSMQNGNNWRTNDLLYILSSMSQIITLTFCNFDALSTTTINQVVSVLPNLQHVVLKYCQVVYRPPIRTEINSLNTCINQKDQHTSTCFKTNSIEDSNQLKFKRLSFVWTEFTEKSIMPSLYSQITCLELGSNRNKYNQTNELMAKSITTYCPSLTHLTITLPQVTEATLCDILISYGTQLQQLSIRCDSSHLLQTIINHNTDLTHLILRVTPSANNDDIRQHILKIVAKCTKLKELEIWSCHLNYDIPVQLWESIIMQSERQLQVRYKKSIIKRAYHVLNLHHENSVIDLSEKSNRTQNNNQNRQPRSTWFNGVVFEEILQQRHAYNIIHGRKLQKNDFERIVIQQPELQKVSIQLQAELELDNEVM